MLITDFIEFHAATRPDNTILIEGNHSLSFEQAVSQSRQVAAWLQSEGIGHGDRVAILGENSTDHVLLLLAACYLGAVIVPLNYRLAATELADIVIDCNARILVVNDPAMVELKKSLIPLLDNQIEVTDALLTADTTLDCSRVSNHDIAIQLYTSGTTGSPKGVQISHRNVEALAITNWTTYQDKPNYDSTTLVVAPLFHIGGLGSTLVHVMSGGSVLLHRQFDAEKIVNDIEQHQIDSLFLVPAMIQTILTSIKDIRLCDFSTLKQMSYGASPISPGLLAEAIEVFGCHFYQFYGMTETTGGVVGLLPEDHQLALQNRPELLQSCGRKLLGVEIKICDASGQLVALGETGEIVVRSDANTSGYWQRPDETDKCIRDGWVYTGDAAMMDEKGYIYIRDRIKDMVVSGGENIYPAEVEKVLAGHTAILEVAVIGVPDDKFGEALMAICVLNKNCDLVIDELITFCRGKIAGYKIPRQLNLLTSLPRNSSGKILKTELRATYWDNRNRQL